MKKIRVTGTWALIEICKSALAGRISTLECAVSPRNECDWFAACRVLEQMPHLIDVPMRSFLGSLGADIGPYPDGFEVIVDEREFRYRCGEMIERNLLQIRRLLPSEQYGAFSI
jgi:hypothetical protein